VAVDRSPYQEPFEEFERWYAEARQKEPRDANAMALATATRHGTPSVRMVLLKGADERGFVFYTNNESRKADELVAQADAALNPFGERAATLRELAKFLVERKK
jgi:pyridoxamine 5'-phosphate oxidase